jgi:hypothetical protein
MLTPGTTWPSIDWPQLPSHAVAPDSEPPKKPNRELRFAIYIQNSVKVAL